MVKGGGQHMDQGGEGRTIGVLCTAQGGGGPLRGCFPGMEAMRRTRAEEKSYRRQREAADWTPWFSGILHASRYLTRLVWNSLSWGLRAS